MQGNYFRLGFADNFVFNNIFLEILFDFFAVISLKLFTINVLMKPIIYDIQNRKRKYGKLTPIEI